MSKEKAGEVTTKQRLMEAAEELFANEGFESVSVREITSRAGANVAAVNYHFGSRTGLVNAVIERYIEPMNQERLRQLTALERRGEATVEEIVETFMRPFAKLVSRSELSERLFAKLMGRTFGGGVALLPESVVVSFGELARRYRKAFGKVLPGLSDADCYWRLHFMVGAMVHTLAHGDMLQKVTGGRCGNPGIDEVLGRCIRFVAAGIREGVDAEPAGKRAGKTVKKVAAKPQEEFDF